ncbi:MAG TPA: exonuclease SbcCD subunit D C-terminal domain-containing protein [Microlunatus sp.]|nr:exonuclease SbcCD subunit D C-terminal domain-containing protein [Microlunatus sp.]
MPAATFAGADYAALGHLHGAQRVAEGVHYSGSPIAYSFSEEHHRKAVLLVDLPAIGGAAVVEHLPTPVERPLARLTGVLDDLLTADRWAGHEGHYLQVTLTDPVRPREPMERLRARFPHVLVLGFAPEGGGEGHLGSYARRLHGRSDLEVAADFVCHVRSEPDPAESALLAEAFEAGRLAEASL